MLPLPVLTPAQAAAWDARAERCGVPAGTLMESAGRAVATLLAARFAERLRQGVLVACGPGNNGGDGWVVARALHSAGAPVWVAASGEPAGELPRAMAALAREAGVRSLQPDGPWPNVGLAVDALLGTGASGAPRGGAGSWWWGETTGCSARPGSPPARSSPRARDWYTWWPRPRR